MVQIVEVAVEDVEAEEAHLRRDDRVARHPADPVDPGAAAPSGMAVHPGRAGSRRHALRRGRLLTAQLLIRMVVVMTVVHVAAVLLLLIGVDVVVVVGHVPVLAVSLPTPSSPALRGRAAQIFLLLVNRVDPVGGDHGVHGLCPFGVTIPLESGGCRRRRGA